MGIIVPYSIFKSKFIKAREALVHVVACCLRSPVIGMLQGYPSDLAGLARAG